MHLFLGSTNPVKINALTIAISETFPDAVVHGVEVASGVAAQPMSDEETRRGAENRARQAFMRGLEAPKDNFQIPKLAKNQKTVTIVQQDPGYSNSLRDSGSGMIGVGMEGGVYENEQGELWNTVWCCVVDQDGKVYQANGERFKLPEVLANQIRAGKEMGPAMDELIGSTNIKHKGGMIGEITKGFIDRTEMYMDLAKLTLGLWYGRAWEPPHQTTT